MGLADEYAGCGKRDRTDGDWRKCSIKIEGSSTKSVAHRVPEQLWYSDLPNMAIGFGRKKW
jgi:hypothetical protein